MQRLSRGWLTTFMLHSCSAYVVIIIPHWRRIAISHWSLRVWPGPTDIFVVTYCLKQYINNNHIANRAKKTTTWVTITTAGVVAAKRVSPVNKLTRSHVVDTWVERNLSLLNFIGGQGKNCDLQSSTMHCSLGDHLYREAFKVGHTVECKVN